MITTVQNIATIGRLRIEITRHETTGALAVSLVRDRRDGPPRSFALHEDELDRALNALDDAADLLLGTDSDSESPNRPKVKTDR
jgi:hypothetical protein